GKEVANLTVSALTETRRRDPTFQVYTLLRTGFVVAPILFGLDKFFNWTVDWTQYLAPWINDVVPGSAQDFMYFVGGVEIAAGLLVLVAPWIGGFVVAAWLAGIVVNLLTVNPPEYYEIALRDFGLFLAAVARARLPHIRGAEAGRDRRARKASCVRRWPPWLGCGRRERKSWAGGGSSSPRSGFPAPPRGGAPR